MAGGGMSAASQQQPGGDVSAGGSTSRFTGSAPPSGYRPMMFDYNKPIKDKTSGEVTGYETAPQFYAPVYQPQYGGYGGFGGYGSPFGGYGGFGGYGSPFGGYGGFGGMGGYGGFGGMGGYGGLDPRAIAADPRGFQSWQQDRQQFMRTGQMPQRNIGQLQQTWSQPAIPYQRMNFGSYSMQGPTGGQTAQEYFDSSDNGAAKGGIMRLVNR